VDPLVAPRGNPANQDACVPQFSAGNTLAGYLTTAVEVLIVVLSVGHIVVGGSALLVVWEAVAVGYLVVGFIVTRHRSLHPDLPVRGRVGVLDTLSWVLPLTASITGVNAAVVVLAQTARSAPTADRVLLATAGAVGIVVSWHLLHVGFAQVHEAVYFRDGLRDGLVFPGTAEPTTVEFVYFAFTIGTAFATSDVDVTTARARWAVTVHSVVSFLFNALVVAVAYQVLQLFART
jgi:uncharacterized membrane protein